MMCELSIVKSDVCVCIFFCMLLNYKKIKKTKKLNVFICIEFGSYFKKISKNIFIYLFIDIQDYNLIRKMYSWY
jgi:hypothetical protein